MGLFNILTVIFVVAKLVGIIHWSWWLVLAPLFVSVFFWVAILALGIAGAMASDN